MDYFDDVDNIAIDSDFNSKKMKQLNEDECDIIKLCEKLKKVCNVPLNKEVYQRYYNQLKYQNITFERIPSEYVDYNMYKIIVNDCASNLEKVPPELIDYNLCVLAGNSRSSSKKPWFKFVPSELIDYNLCKLAASQGYANEWINYVPTHMFNLELWKLAIDTDACTIDKIPEDILSQFIDYEFCKNATIRNPKNMQYIPKKYIDNELCKKILKKNMESIQYIPSYFMNEELCKYIFNRKYYEEEYLKYIPSYLINKSLSKLAVYCNGCNIKYVPNEFIDKKLCEDAIKSDASSIKYIPCHLIDYELCELAVIYGKYQLKKVLPCIPPHLFDYALCEKIVTTSSVSLTDLPIHLIDYPLCEKIVKKEPANVTEIPTKFVDKKLCSHFFDEIKENKCSSIDNIPTVIILHKHTLASCPMFIAGLLEYKFIYIIQYLIKNAKLSNVAIMNALLFVENKQELFNYINDIIK